MDSTKDLDKEDLEAVAKAIGCSERYVKMTVEGDRGARRTPIQQKILKAWDLRMEQKKQEDKLHTINCKKLVRFCERLQVQRVVLK